MPDCRTLRAPSALHKEKTRGVGDVLAKDGESFPKCEALKARMNSAPLRCEMSVMRAKISAQKTLFENVGRRRGGGKGHRRRKDNGHKVKCTSRIGASSGSDDDARGERILKAEDHMMPSSRSFCCHFQAVVSESRGCARPSSPALCWLCPRCPTPFRCLRHDEEPLCN